MIDRRALPHALIFSGPAGAGKAHFARCLARYAEAQTFDDAGLSQDMVLVSPDAGSVGIDAIRSFKQSMALSPAISPYRIGVVDDAHLMTTEAQNALLKLAEEPPPAGVVILVAPDAQLLLPTVRSRFQQVHFGTVGQGEVREFLGDRGVAPEAAERLASKSFGLPGFALRLVNDAALKARFSSAQKLLTMTDAARAAFIKELAGEEDFDLAAFLDALIWQLYAAGKFADSPHQRSILSRTLVLKERASRYNLSSKIQLQAIFAK
jgi:DNA polymerase-3 subunit delta'